MSRTAAMLGVITLSTVGASAQSDLLRVTSQHSIAVSTEPKFVVFHPNSKLLAVGGVDSVEIFNFEGSRQSVLRPCPASDLVTGTANRDGELLGFGCENGSIALAHWDGSPLAKTSPRGHTKRVIDLDFSSSGPYLVSIGEDRTLKLWNLDDGSEIRRAGTDIKKPYVFAGFSSSGLSVLALTREGKLIEWDTKTGRKLRSLNLDENTAFAAALDHSGSLLAVSGEYATLSKGSWEGPINPANFYRSERLLIFDLKRGLVIKQIDGIEGQLRALSFSSDSRFLAGVRQSVRSSALTVFDLQRGVEILSQPASLRSLVTAFTPSSNYLAGINLVGSVELLEIAGLELSVQPGDLAGQRIRSTSPSQAPLIAAASNDTLAIIDLDAVGVDKSVGRTLAEMLRNQIVGSGARVVTRDRMAVVIAEQNISLSDRTDATTAITLGRLLSANRMVFGSVSALGSDYIVNVQLVDVQTGQVQGVREVLCQRCSVEDLPDVVLNLKSLLVASPR